MALHEIDIKASSQKIKKKNSDKYLGKHAVPLSFREMKEVPLWKNAAPFFLFKAKKQTNTVSSIFSLCFLFVVGF